MVAVLGVGAALIPQSVSAHALLLETDPPANSVLESPPIEVTLFFSEPVTPAGAGIRVYSPTGHQVAAAAMSRGSVLLTSVTAGESGTYIVSWQVLASDTHPSRGAFRFVVHSPSSNPYSFLVNTPEVGTATPAGVALQTLARWVHFVGFALVVGVVAYRILIKLSAGFSRLVGLGVALLIAAEPIALLGQLASLSFDANTALAVLESAFGRLLGLRLGAALLLWVVVATGRSSPLMAVGGVIALLDGFSAHAFPALPGAGQLLVAVHVTAMALWAGGLAAFVLAPDRRFGHYATSVLGVAVLTGLLLAFAHTHFGASLVTTDYGRALLLKVFVVVVAVVAAVVARRRLELATVLAVIASAALVAVLPPPF